MEYEIGMKETVSSAVINAVAAVEGRDPCSLPPLLGVVDTDALDELFSPRRNSIARRGGELTFVYDNCRVTVNNGEHLTLELLEPMTPRNH